MIVGGTVRTADGGKLGVLSGSFSSEAINVLRSAPGRARWRERSWYFEPTSGNVDFLSKEFPYLTWEDGGALRGRVATLRDLESRSADVKSGDAPVSDFQFKTEPYLHQRRAFLLGRERDFFGLIPMDMGTGKSKVALDIAAWRSQYAGLRAVVILAPNGVHRKWSEQQIPEHWAGGPLRNMLWTSSRRDTLAVEIETANRTTPPGTTIVVCVNIEALSQGAGARPAKQVIQLLESVRRTGGKSMVVVDESTRIKTPSAQRTRTAYAIGAEADHRLILSGTPVTKGVEDLYAQLQFLSRDILDCRTYTAFKARYCNMGGFEGRQVIGYRNLDDLMSRMSPWTFGVRKEECLDLPPTTYDELPVDLTPEQRRVYSDLRDEFLVKLDSGDEVGVDNALSLLTALQCVVCGYLPVRNDEGKIVRYEVLPCNRPATMMSLLEGFPRQFVVWARFRRDIDNILEALSAAKITAVRYDGSVSEADRADNLATFIRGEAQGFVGTQSAGGIGLDLVVADLAIFYSNSFDRELRWQAEARTHRIGQTRPVNYYDLVSPGTIDRKILSAFKSTAGVVELLFPKGAGPSATREKMKEFLSDD